VSVSVPFSDLLPASHVGEASRVEEKEGGGPR
jgi:hypothetical protein